MLSGWNEFVFFDAIPIKDPSPESSLLYSDPNALDFRPSDRGTVFVSTRLGVVKEFNKSLELINEFVVCNEEKTPDFVRPVPNTHLVITASSQLGQPLEVSVWDLKESKEAGKTPQLHSRVLVSHETNTYPLTVFEIKADISVLVLGFADGSVIAVRGDLMHDRGTRQRLIHKFSTGITGLALTKDADRVYVSSVSQIAVVSTTSAKHFQILDKAKGADLNCTAAAAKEEFLVARDADVAFFNLHHRGPTFELDVAKRAVYLTKEETKSRGNRYLVLVAVFGPSNQSLLSTESKRLLVVDLVNHLIAYDGYLGTDIKAIFEQWDQINIISSDGILHSLIERPLEQRIAALKARNLYQVAIAVAESELENPATDRLALMLHQDFAEYLYDKNDIDGALKEYIAAIELGQSSRAIRKFKDSQHVSTLLRYLDALYKRDQASSQHITLQIICYTKLNLYNELERFLKSVVKRADFDFEQAVNILTETQDQKYGRLAAYVAEMWPDPDLVVQIMLRVLDNVQETLDYIQTVSVADALRLLIQNSRLLLNRLPVETTGVLITLFTGKFITKERAEDPTKNDQNANSNSTSTLANTLDGYAPPVLQSYQAFIKYLSSGNYLGSHIVSAETLESDISEPSYLPPRPRLIFPSFIGHDNEFVIFLEACLQVAPNFHSSEKDLSDIATTLFETYLRVGLTDSASLLVDSHANVLYATRIQTAAEMSKFELNPSQQVALGSTYSDVFRQSCRSEHFSTALQVLFDHHSSDPEMAIHAVSLLTSTSQGIEYLRAENLLTKVLQLAVDAGASHVQLISELSASPYLTVKDIEPFITGFLKSTEEQTQRHLKLADSYQLEIEEKKKTLEKMEGEALVVNYDECLQCHQPIELPAVHYGCKHSYHKQCLVNEQLGCPMCRTETETMESIRKQSSDAAAHQDYFLDELDSKNDKMRVIMDFISRGALSEIH